MLKIVGRLYDRSGKKGERMEQLPLKRKFEQPTDLKVASAGGGLGCVETSQPAASASYCVIWNWGGGFQVRIFPSFDDANVCFESTEKIVSRAIFDPSGNIVKFWFFSKEWQGNIEAHYKNLDFDIYDTESVEDKATASAAQEVEGEPAQAKSCSHVCVVKWSGQYVCNQCYSYFNFDDGIVGINHCRNLRDTAREKHEREIEASIIPDPIPTGLSEGERKDYVGKLSQGRGVTINWLVDFTIENDCWDMTTQEVCNKFVFPLTAARRCRYVELDHMMKGCVTGPASTFISHCRGGTWGDLVAAVCDGGADRNRRVWVDIFACRQWPSSKPDLDFESTIRQCSSFMIVCSSLKEVENLGWKRIGKSRDTNSLSKSIRSKIAFLRVWCLMEIYTATQCKDMPIIMKGGSYTMVDKCKSLFEFVPNTKMLYNLSWTIDIINAEATVLSDKEMILDQVRGSDRSGIEKLNSKVRGTIVSAFEFSKRDVSIAGIVQNAACGDSSSLALVLAHNDYFLGICIGGFTALLRDYRILQTYKGDINAKLDSFGNTILINTCWGGHTDTVSLLIDMGADINMQNSNGSTALIQTCIRGHTDVAKLLIAKGADVNMQNEDRTTALLRACREGHTDTAKLLIDEGADIHTRDLNEETALMIACKGGRTYTAKLLIDNGADINVQSSIGRTALSYACRGGHTDTARLLIDRGGDTSVLEQLAVKRRLLEQPADFTVSSAAEGGEAETSQSAASPSYCVVWHGEKGYQIKKFLSFGGASDCFESVVYESKAIFDPSGNIVKFWFFSREWQRNIEAHYKSSLR